MCGCLGKWMGLQVPNSKANLIGQLNKGRELKPGCQTHIWQSNQIDFD